MTPELRASIRGPALAKATGLVFDSMTKLTTGTSFESLVMAVATLAQARVLEDRLLVTLAASGTDQALSTEIEEMSGAIANDLRKLMDSLVKDSKGKP